MLSKKIEKALNDQLSMEAYASFYYLSAASWCHSSSLDGCAKFLYGHSEEEKAHMLRLFNYINDTGGHAITPAVKQPPFQFKNIADVFDSILKHELAVTKSINAIVDMCLNEKDHSTFNFLQWYVAEQHEEEKLFRSIIDKIKLIGDDKRGVFWIDKELSGLSAK